MEGFNKRGVIIYFYNSRYLYIKKHDEFSDKEKRYIAGIKTFCG